MLDPKLHLWYNRFKFLNRPKFFKEPCMAKWVRSGVLDSGLNDIKNNVTRIVLLSAYAAGDSAATVNANTLAYVASVSTDFTLSSSGSNRLLTVASGKVATATATAGGIPDLHMAFTDGTTTAINVIWVTDISNDQPITSGNVINFPAPVYTNNQPT